MDRLRLMGCSTLVTFRRERRYMQFVFVSAV